MPNISVIIPTFNSTKYLPSCLNSIKNQSTHCADILVVDRKSNDGTIDVAKAFGARVIQTNANRSVARNIGLDRSASTAVLFVDADMVLPSNLIEECGDQLEKHDALVIPEASVGDGFWSKCKALEKQTYIGNELIEAARCFQRRALVSIGGYNPNLVSGEDWDLQARAKSAGLSIGRVKATITHCEGHLTLSQAFRRKHEYGKTIRHYLNANRSLGLKQVNPVRRVLSASIRTMPTDPACGVGVLLLKSIEFAGAGVGLIQGN